MDGARSAGDTVAAPRLVLVDVDTGTDDALALLMLLAADAADEIRLLGVTCVAGNTSLHHVCRNTLRLLAAANRLDIPVFAGAEHPIICDRVIKTDYHGLDGFGDLDYKDFPGLNANFEGLLQKENAVVALNRIVSENEGEVTLMCLAPLTNVALAIRTYPAFRRSLRELHIMGGNIRGSGNTTPTAEFNFAADPEAAHVVLESVSCPVQVTPWEPCPSHPIELEWRLTHFPAAPGGLALQLLTEVERRVLAKHAKSNWVCCDQFAVAALLRPELVARSHLRHVTVELAGSRTRGQMVPDCVRWNGVCEPDCQGRGEDGVAGRRRPARVLEAFDLAAFKDLLKWAAQRWTRPS